MLREETMGGRRHYVVQSGSRREIFFRADDLAYVMDKVDGDVNSPTRSRGPRTGPRKTANANASPTRRSPYEAWYAPAVKHRMKWLGYCTQTRGVMKFPPKRT